MSRHFRWLARAPPQLPQLQEDIAECPLALLKRLTGPRLKRIGSSFFFNISRKYRAASLIQKRNPLGPYRRPMPVVLRGSQGGGRFLMGKVAPGYSGAVILGNRLRGTLRILS